METNYCLLNINGEVYGVTDHVQAFSILTIEEIIDLYRLNCFYQRIHNDIIVLIEKGLILPNENEYPKQYVQNTINYLGDLIEAEFGVFELKEIQSEINENLKDEGLTHDLMHNIMVSFNFQLNPSVINILKNGEL